VILAGRRLSVDVVLTGSIQRDEDRVRVAVEMVDVTNERIVWGETFDENSSKLFDLQDSIAAEVITALQRPRFQSELLQLRESFGNKETASISNPTFQLEMAYQLRQSI
jgi:hypothetical protein